MMSVEIDPSERRAQAAERPVSRRPALLAAAAGLGLAACGGLALAAYPKVQTLLAPPSTGIRVGPVADMPEIKDGLPALKAETPAPVRVVAIPPATPAAAAPPPAP
ncbi:MAG: chemotaxis protein CheA, partial [Methylobacterium sp.]|nr:chemotaxis protein CheA [Methylobacterium sp.]